MELPAESVLGDAALAPGTSHASGVYTSQVVDPEPLLPSSGSASASDAAAVAAEVDPREATYVRSMVWVSAIVFLQFLCQMITALAVFPDELISYMNNGVSCEGSVAASDHNCKSANARYTLLTSIVTSIGCFLTFLGSPLLGTASDAYGRRPAVFFCAIWTTLQAGAMMCFALWRVSLNLYFAMTIMSSFDATSVLLAYLSDTVPPHRRAYCFGTIFAMISLAVTIGPFIGSAVDPHMAYMLSFGISVVYLLAVLALPESLPRALRVPMKSKDLSPFRGFAVLARFSMFRRLALVVFVTEFVARGKFAINFSFLKTEFGISEQFFAILAAVFGALGVLSQSVVLKQLVKVLSNQRIMLIGVVAAALNMGAYCVIWLEWQVFPIEVFSCLSFMSFPAVSAMKSNNVSQREQGSIQGALYGVKQLGGGLGPVVFGAIFNAFTRDGARWFNPHFVWYVATTVSVLAIGIALTVQQDVTPDEHEAHRVETQARVLAAQEDALLAAEKAAGLNAHAFPTTIIDSEEGDKDAAQRGVTSKAETAPRTGMRHSTSTHLLGSRYTTPSPNGLEAHVAASAMGAGAMGGAGLAGYPQIEPFNDLEQTLLHQHRNDEQW